MTDASLWITLWKLGISHILWIFWVKIIRCFLVNDCKRHDSKKEKYLYSQ